MTGHEPKRPFLPIRDGAGSFEIDNPEDGSPIREMISLKRCLLLVTDKCVYEVQLADQIDPKRLNPNLPHNVNRKLLDLGVNSASVSRVLLQSVALFKKEHLKLDVDAAISLAVSALEEIASLESIMRDFTASENAAIERFNLAKKQQRSIALPTLDHLEARCKSFAQRAHHFGRNLLHLVKLFYPAVSNWDDVKSLASSKYGKEDQFTKFVATMVPGMHVMSSLRNNLDHQLSGVVVRNFSLEIDGTVAPPTIELHSKNVHLPRSSVSRLMAEVFETLVFDFEQLVVHVSSKNLVPFAGLETRLIELPEADQRARHVRYGYETHLPSGATGIYL